VTGTPAQPACRPARSPVGERVVAVVGAARTPPRRLDLAATQRLAELADLITPMAVRAMCALDVPDHLADGPLSVDVLARRAGAHPGALRRTLRLLAAKGLFCEPAPDVYGLTPLSAPLRRDHPLTVRDTYTLLDCDVRAWGRLGHTARTGEPGFALANGAPYWEYLAGHPERSAAVDRWMENASRLHLRTVLPGYPWRELGTVVDVGGGTGGFLAGLLRRHPDQHGILFDLPHVVAGAPEVLAAAGVADRCRIVAGSFFDGVPAGADGYLLKTVLPGFPDDDAVAVLGTVRAAMRPDSRLIALEAVLPPGDAFDVAKLFDVHTLVLTGGAHRALADERALFTRAGLRLTRVVPTPTLTILEAVRDEAEA
jgi:O-methyltransferase domain